jgi:ABC-type nickel/cobalt efflux system permease component RcnA
MSASLLSLGFVLGMRHAMETDHVAAVASLATRSVSGADTARLAAMWGVGHTLTLLVFCCVVVALDTVMPQQLAQALELGVGVLLVALGADVLRRLWREGQAQADHPVHAHACPGSTHEAPDRGRFPLRALLVGMMHGMAGSAALILLTLETAQSAQTAVLYVLLFGVGSIVGMITFSVLISVPLSYARGISWLRVHLRGAIGGATVCIGTWMVYDIAVAGGLLV